MDAAFGAFELRRNRGPHFVPSGEESITMRISVRIGRHAHSALANPCLLESLEARQLLSTSVPNIMPLGDSITEAQTGNASYRYWLWNSLADAGYTLDFVGSEQPPGIVDGHPRFPGFDPNHE